MEVDRGAPGRAFPKRLLPQSIASETLHGPINKTERSAGEQAALEKRKNEILQSMSKEQIEAEYSGQAVKINEHLTRKKKKNDEIDSRIGQLKDEHDMEMRVLKAALTKQDEKREIGAEKQGSADGELAAVKQAQDETKDDEHEEGEIEMAG